MRLSMFKPLIWVGVGAALVTGATPLMKGIDRRVFDLQLGMRRDHGWPPDLVMVAIDDALIGKTERWPWPRAKQGQFLEAIKGLGAKTILLDVFYGSPSDPANDAAFVESLAKTRPILGFPFSPDLIEGTQKTVESALVDVHHRAGLTIGPEHLITPIPAFASNAGGLGASVMFPSKADAQVRSMTPLFAVTGRNEVLPSTPLLALLSQRGHRVSDVELGDDAITLPGGKPIPLFRSAIYMDLVPGGARPPTVRGSRILAAMEHGGQPPANDPGLRGELEGKLAIVSVDSVYTPDELASPISPRTNGGVLLAYGVRTLDGGHVPVSVPAMPVLLGCALIALAAARPLGERLPGTILGVSAIASLVYLLLACALVPIADVFLPTAPAFLFLVSGGFLTAYSGRVGEIERTQMRALLDSVKRAYSDDRATKEKATKEVATRVGPRVEPVQPALPATDASGASGPSNMQGSRPAEVGVGRTTGRGSVPETKSGAELLVGGQPLDEPVQIGQYEVQRAIGKGGMGAIFLAIDRDLDRPVAIKILESATKETFVRFRREALAIARISHPNVVQVYEVGLDSKVPFIVMEYVAGGTLSDLLRDPDVPMPLPWDRATKIAAGVARGLGAAHVKGIVHRDMKPANVLLLSRKTEFPKIADFGIARISGAEQLTREGLVVGTVGYLSPEQALGKPVDARSDVYSLAVMFYRMLTGERAFEGTTEEMLRASVTRGIPDPREVNPSIPNALAELVVRMGSLDKETRPKDGNVAAQALELLLSASAAEPTGAAVIR